MAMNSVAKKVENFVLAKPFVKESMKKGIVNFSALSRKIIVEEKLRQSDFDAVVVALRRLSSKHFPTKDVEAKIIALLKKGKIEVKNKITVIVLDDDVFLSQLAKIVNQAIEDGETFHLIRGSKTFTIITSFEVGQKIGNFFRVNFVSEKNNLVEIIVRTGKEIESTPGVVAYMYSRFAENGVNILETLSSWTETLFVIEEKDTLKAMNAMKI